MKCSTQREALLQFIIQNPKFLSRLPTPVHIQPWYRQTYGYAPGKCPNAEAFYAQALSLPLYPALTDADVQHVIQAVRALV